MPEGGRGVTGTHGREEGKAIGRSLPLSPENRSQKPGFPPESPGFGAKFGLMGPILSSSGGPAPPAWPSARDPTPPAGGRPGPHDRHERCDRRGGSGGREGKRAILVPFLPLLPEILGWAGPAVAVLRPRPDAPGRGRTTGATRRTGLTCATGRRNPHDRPSRRRGAW